MQKWGGELPSLAKEGCLRASRFPELRADGVVGSMSRKPPYRFPRSAPYARSALARESIRWLRDIEPTTPAAPAKEASRHFLNGRSHPSLAKEGNPLCPGITCVPSSVGKGRGGHAVKKMAPSFDGAAGVVRSAHSVFL